jgi:uncharacterized protein with PIN domain
MEWLWYSVVLLYVLGMVMWFALSVRPPRCSSCRVPAIALAYQIDDISPPVFQVVYRCPRCRAIIWKRFVNAVSN